MKSYVDGEDDGEAADSRRVGEVRRVVLVEWHRALWQEGHGGLYGGRRWHLPLLCRRRALHLAAEVLSTDDALFQQLWRTYFKAICIKERMNPKKQLSDMPRRYWKYMTEKK